MHWTVQCLVAVAALIFITHEIIFLLHTLSVRLSRKTMERLKTLHLKASETITPSFEVWWEENAREKTTTTIASRAPSHIKALVEQGAPTELMLEVLVAEIKRQAYHVAVHAYLNGHEEKWLARLRWQPLMKSEVAEWLLEHDTVMNEAHQALIEVGIDPEQLQQHFAPAKAN